MRQNNSVVKNGLTHGVFYHANHFVKNQSQTILQNKHEIMKRGMKNLITAAILTGGALMVSQSALAQVALISNDLYMGFENQAGGGTSDYIINLGAASSLVGGSSVVNLSSDFSLSDFNAVLGSSSSMFGGVVAGSNGNPPDLYVTQLRSGGAGTPSVPGSTSPASFYKGDILTGYSDLSQLLNLPAAGNGLLDTSKYWESYVEPTFAAGTLYGDTGINPDSTVGTNSILYEDLWYVSNSSSSVKKPFTYVGYFTLNLAGSPSLTFTPTNAPAPPTSPVIVSVGKVGSTITLVSSNAVPTHTYQLQYTASLSPTNWISVGSSVVAGSPMVTNTDTTATDSQRFYRVQAQ
ncbi:MAG TPA: hypothetical protein VKU37_13435 [Verrucomicrobiae bacterium]|nr:hypothetical protein [Verrucomicrobiae bacterium]